MKSLQIIEFKNDKEKQGWLEAILDIHHEHKQESSKAILEVLKNGSKNYGELNKRLEIFKKAILFQQKNINKYESIFIEIDKMLEKEMNDLPLINQQNKL